MVWDKEDEFALMVMYGDLEKALRLVQLELRERETERICRRVFALRPQEAEDAWALALQETWNFLNSGKYSTNAPFLPWLRRLLKLRAIDVIRKRPPEHLTDWSAENAPYEPHQDLHHVSPEPEPVVVAVQEAMEALSPWQLLVYREWLYTCDGRKDVEQLRAAVIRAKGEHVTVAAIKNAIQQARRKVREFLEAKGHTVKGGQPR